MPEPHAGDVAATFCATLVDEWVRHGVTRAVVAPGSRSTPMALALLADPRVAVSVHHDERSAGFVALGVGIATGLPAVVLTTSGTATAELHAAVVEAHHAGVPMLVCTADRPPELHGVGAPQTIDQTNLYGSAVRAFYDPGVPDGRDSADWRHLARSALDAALGSPPGPVQVNLAFTEPLVGTPGPLPDVDGSTTAGAGGCEPDTAEVALVADAARFARGVIVAGGGIARPADVLALAARLGWPVIADPRSGCRVEHPCVVAHVDALLRDPPTATRLNPEVVLRLGDLPASKVLGRWLDDIDGARQIGVTTYGTRFDPGRSLDVLIAGEPGALCAAVTGQLESPSDSGERGWLATWRVADDAAAQAIAATVDAAGEPSEPAVARTVVASAPRGVTLVVSSSMPIRDVEWYSAPRSDLGVRANRGANGIDGVVSTALGMALASSDPVVVLIGDVAALHDSTALVGLPARGVDLTVVVVDNDGGGIFSFLPQSAALDARSFEVLFGTPHGVDLVGLAAAHGISAATLRTTDELATFVSGAIPGSGARVGVVHTERATNVEVHDAVHASVADALRSAPTGE